MALSIKNEEAERLARELAAQTGSNVTQAVIRALREALLRQSGRASSPSVLAAILDISERCSALPDLDNRSADQILAYDEHGTFR